MIARKFIALTVFSTLFFSTAHSEDCFECNLPINPGRGICDARLEVGYATDDYIALDEPYFEIGLFVPFTVSNLHQNFIDARGYKFNDQTSGASLGLGTRFWGFDERVWGLNIYYDYRKGKIFGDFHRVGLGWEWLGPCWDFRINAYIPTGTQYECFEVDFFNQITGLIDSFENECEYAIIGGFDAEYGRPLGSWCDYHFYGAFGTYFYHNPADDSFWGGMLRLEVDWNSYVTAELITTYDTFNRSQTQGRVMIRVPFEFFTTFCCPSESHAKGGLFTQPVRRNGVVFVDSFTTDPIDLIDDN